MAKQHNENKQMNGGVRNDVVCKSVIEKQTKHSKQNKTKQKQNNIVNHAAAFFLILFALTLTRHYPPSLPPTLYARKLRRFFCLVVLHFRKA